MTIPYEDVFKEFSLEDQRWIKQRAEELKAEELTLRELRRLRKLTQTHLSKKLKVGQEGISRMERRTDLYISTLRGYVEGVGGKLSLVVEFPDRPSIILAGLGGDEDIQDPEKVVADIFPATEASTGMIGAKSVSGSRQELSGEVRSFPALGRPSEAHVK
jgi:transcriptional regulator with XRE-family HTH domain